MSRVPARVLAARSRAELIVDATSVIKAIDQIAVKLKVALFAENPLVVCVMNGGLLYTGALLRRLQLPLEMTYVHVSRYHGAVEGSELQWHAMPQLSLNDRHVVFVDDVLDQGNTLAALCVWAREAGAQTVTTTVLVDKQIADTRSMEVDFAALKCPDRHLIGWGMDYQGYWRDLPEIWAIPRTTAIEDEATA